MGSGDLGTRSAGSARFVVVSNPGDAPVQLRLTFADAASGHGGHLAPVDIPGLGGVRETAIVDGVAAIEIEPVAGALLRVV